MSRPARILRTAALAAAGTLLAAAATSACPTCYGQAQGPMIDGMNTAILAMIGITGFVLGGFGALFVSIGRRIRRTAAGADGTTTNDTEST